MSGKVERQRVLATKPQPEDRPPPASVGSVVNDAVASGTSRIDGRPNRPSTGRCRLQRGPRKQAPTSTVVFDTYWHFARERLAIYERRVRGDEGPATTDAILATYRFTNAYRVTDRVSQYLLRQVQYDETRSAEPRELFFRTLLFKIFNRIDTWERLEGECGALTWADVDLERLDRSLEAMRLDRPIYSAAYIMPAPAFGAARKHTNHLRMLARMMEDRLPDRIRQARGLEDVYALLLGYPGIGRFLAFQYAIDLNYSSLLDHGEDGFVVAGPGALDGISKCFSDLAGWSPERVIHWVADRQEREFADRGIAFPGLHGRRLQPIDCQNLFCEISKYARVAHPEVVGCADRTRIKQVYRRADRPLAPQVFPPRWKLVPQYLSTLGLLGRAWMPSVANGARLDPTDPSQGSPTISGGSAR